jgi:DNA-binding NarL/FixJ family response regulator
MLLLLDYQPGIYVVGLADRLPGLSMQLEGAQPDVLLLDWELSDQSMAAWLSDFHNLERHPKVIVLSADPQMEKAILAAGADFIICKDAPPDKLIPVLNDIRLSKTKKNNQAGASIE